MAIYYHSNVGDAKSMQDAVMAIYYHSNVGDAKSMQDAVMAIYYHSNVSDAKSRQDAVMAIYYHSKVGDAKSMQDAVMANAGHVWIQFLTLVFNFASFSSLANLARLFLDDHFVYSLVNLSSKPLTMQVMCGFTFYLWSSILQPFCANESSATFPIRPFRVFFSRVHNVTCILQVINVRQIHKQPNISMQGNTKFTVLLLSEDSLRSPMTLLETNARN